MRPSAGEGALQSSLFELRPDKSLEVGGKKKDGQKLTPVKSATLVFCEEFHWVKKVRR